MHVALLQPKLAAQLAAASGKSYEPYIKQQQLKYQALKAHEAEFPSEVASSLQKARLTAIITPHYYELNRLPSPPTQGTN